MSVYNDQKQEQDAALHFETDQQRNLSQVDERQAVLLQAGEEHVTAWLCAILGLMCLIPFTTNFDSNWTGTALAMNSFNAAFGSDCTVNNDAVRTCRMTTEQQALLSVAYLFQAVGGAFAGWFSTRLGRRVTISVGSVFTVASAAGLLGTNHGFAVLVVCKCISGVGQGMLLSVGITYGAECAPASKRDHLLGVFNIGLTIGSLLSSGICWGSSQYPPLDNWQWKTPVAVQIPVGVILGSLVWIFPESPRMLIIKGRIHAAREAFAKFLGVDADSDFVTAQVENVEYHLHADRTTRTETRWTDIYRGKDLFRTIKSGFVLTALAICGANFVAPYAALFFEKVGLSNPFTSNFIVSSVILGGGLFGPFAIKAFGCRRLMLGGYSVMAVCMLIFSAVSSGLGSKSRTSQIVLIVCLCIWGFCLGLAIGSTVWQVSGDMHSTRLRNYGQASTTACYQTFGFASSFWSPYTIASLGDSLGYLYFAIDLLVAILVFLLVQETGGLVLEEIEDLDLPAWKTSLRKNKERQLAGPFTTAKQGE